MDTLYSENLNILASSVLSLCAFFVTNSLISSFKELFINAGLFGRDLCKKDGGKVPEAAGVISGCVFLITMFIFIPIAFGSGLIHRETFPHNEFAELLAALLSVCCMLVLGLADDVLDLRWRHKLLLPTVASLPLLVVYYVNFNSTTVVLPVQLRHLVGHSLDIGVLYYVYMGMLAVFCTNAINILAGINGLEAGQSVVIAGSIAVFNAVELAGEQRKAHAFSLYIMLPYLATTFALLRHNWYPSKVFVGDTFCYVSGMTFAVVGILGHFSKTVLLFFVPQIFNFLYSVPQLFHFLPCPRHRLPKYNSDIDKLEPSRALVDKQNTNIIGNLILKIFSILRIVDVQDVKECYVNINNLTLINLVLIKFGPMSEPKLTSVLLLIQILCSCLAFVIRYPLASYFYET